MYKFCLFYILSITIHLIYVIPNPKNVVIFFIKDLTSSTQII